jgi:hypothetical protein
MNPNRVPPRQVRWTATLTATTGGSLCSPAHVEVWKKRRERAHLDADVTTGDYETTEGCAHCIVCGVLVAAPEVCAIHGTDCPTFALELTETLVMVVNAMHEAGVPWPLDDDQFAAVWETSEMLHEAKAWSAHELMARCLDLLT